MVNRKAIMQLFRTMSADDDLFLPLNPANPLASGSVSLRIPEKEKGKKLRENKLHYIEEENV